MADTNQPPTAPEPAPPRKSKAVLFIAIAIVLLAGGGAAGWMLLRPAADSAAKKPAPSHEGGGIVSFEPFVANLADPGGARYLRISVRLIVPGSDDAEHIQKSEVQLMRIRSGILELLGEQKADEIVKPAGKAALKQAIAERAGSIIEPVKVSDVLFSDFVVQF